MRLIFQIWILFPWLNLYSNSFPFLASHFYSFKYFLKLKCLPHTLTPMCLKTLYPFISITCGISQIQLVPSEQLHFLCDSHLTVLYKMCAAFHLCAYCKHMLIIMLWQGSLHFKERFFKKNMTYNFHKNVTFFFGGY